VLSEADSTFPIKFSLVATDDLATQGNNPSSPIADDVSLGTDYYHKTLSCGPDLLDDSYFVFASERVYSSGESILYWGEVDADLLDAGGLVDAEDFAI